MTSFDLITSALSSDTEALSLQDLTRPLRSHELRRRFAHLRHWFHLSELDQAFVLWGAIALAVFSLGEFSQLSWTTQAVIDAALTGAGIAGTAGLTWLIACEARLRWVVCLWAVLMMAGMIVTAGGIFGGVGVILANLCVLWLALCAVGYGAMAWGMRSHCFSAASGVHGLAMVWLCLQPGSQFLISGLVMGLTLFFFSIVPWDMRTAEADG
ncbi:hypothetical protein [Leptolyngbya sp. BC1307]|uniref:hypothetical protein n=1 Tax=Leptolyngbya sp. BC1307 TaxID=2029589 RepID=UPI000EFA91E0|nr:hypothetical protein [Leptolyngbya sp. BC1307]